MKFIERQELLAGLLILTAAGGAYWLYRHRDLFNPASQNNLANRGANVLVQAATGGAAAGGEDSLGGIAARVKEFFTGENASITAPVTQSDIDAYRRAKAIGSGIVSDTVEDPNKYYVGGM